MFPRPCYLLGLTLLCACGPRNVDAPLPRPTAAQIVEHVQKKHQQARSFIGESVMDYWTGKERVKGTVLVMGSVGARVLFNALNPDAGTNAVEMACDGTHFQYINYNENCILRGVCDRHAIAQLLRVSLAPDDFLFLSVGTTPLIPDPSGEVSWDAKRGAEVVKLRSADQQWRQTLVVDGRSGSGHWDVLESTVENARGETEWKLTNKQFETIRGEDGEEFRVPERTRFEQPREKADLIVRWEQRTLNPKLEEDKFKLELPAGMPICGEKKGP